MDRRRLSPVNRIASYCSMRRFREVGHACVLSVGLLVFTGCAQQMAAQPSYRPLENSDFFEDGTSARQPVPGTIARGHLETDILFYEGLTERTPENLRLANLVGPDHKAPIQPSLEQIATIPYAQEFPFPVTGAVLDRGQQRYRIYCSVCHGDDGTGNGVVVQRGFTRPPTYHSDRLRKAPPGYFFDLITHGLGSMPSYGQQIAPRDRWAIVAYLRALQLSQHAELENLSEGERRGILNALESQSDSAQ